MSIIRSNDRAQQPFELLKSTFGEMKCFLLQINSGNSQIQQDVPDYWKKFLRRHPKGSVMYFVIHHVNIFTMVILYSLLGISI